jgi:dinuclear metal center YbgI/SA1388 family protein
MKIKEIISILEELAPLSYSESFDNTGLLVGDQDNDITGILVTLDTLESVVDEAIKTQCNLIVSFHPIVFSGLKKITGKNYVERVVIKAIQNNIAIFSMHTALDNSWIGVNAMICDKLCLQNKKILIPKKDTIQKLVTYVPLSHADNVRNALFEQGAGTIGNYSNCSFNLKGFGSFKGNEESKPVIGKKGEVRFEDEIQIGITFQRHNKTKILNALFKSHPYEEVAYEVTTLENSNQKMGLGMIGELKDPLSEGSFLKYLKDIMDTECIRHSKLLGGKIEKVAVLGGSGSFAITAAIQAGAQVFVTADLKYHDFFKAEKSILLADIGHYESEQYTKDLIVSFLNKKISNFAPASPAGRVVLSKINTNPIRYY